MGIHRSDDCIFFQITLNSGRPTELKQQLQDFERGRTTEIDFINGFVVTLGHASGVPVHMNSAITNLVHQIERVVLQPTRERMNELADQTCERTRGNSI